MIDGSVQMHVHIRIYRCLKTNFQEALHVPLPEILHQNVGVPSILVDINKSALDKTIGTPKGIDKNVLEIEILL